MTPKKDKIMQHLPKQNVILQNVFFDIGCICVFSTVGTHLS